MSDYATIKSITIKNEILAPKIFKLVRDGNLTLSDLQETYSPLVDIYAKTYNYLTFPDVSEEEKKFIMKQQQK